jgi:hypothetical protein
MRQQKLGNRDARQAIERQQRPPYLAGRVCSPNTDNLISNMLIATGA